MRDVGKRPPLRIIICSAVNDIRRKSLPLIRHPLGDTFPAEGKAIEREQQTRMSRRPLRIIICSAINDIRRKSLPLIRHPLGDTFPAEGKAIEREQQTRVSPLL